MTGPERDTVIEGAARAIWVQFWASGCSCGAAYRDDCDSDTPGHIPNDPGMGAELMDLAPETPDSARETASALIAGLAGQEAWQALLQRDDVVNDLDGLGHYLAMQALGHGVQWSDNHPGHGLAMPFIDYYA